MKKATILLSAIAFGLTFTSCSKDDDSISGSLEGKWNFSKELVKISGQAVTPEEDYSGNEEGCNKDYIEFLAGGVAHTGDYNEGCILTEEDGTWVKSGSDLTITSPEGNHVAKIVKLSSTVLKVKTTETFEGMTITSTLTLVKAE